MRGVFEKYGAKGLRILGVCLDKEADREKAVAFAKELGLPDLQAFDGKAFQGPAAHAYGIQGIPAVFLIDAEGKIAAKDLFGDGVEKAVEALLGKP